MHRCKCHVWHCRLAAKILIAVALTLQILYGVIHIYKINNIQYPVYVYDSFNGTVPNNTKILVNDNFTLSNDYKTYFIRISKKLYCYKEGTDWTLTSSSINESWTGRIAKCECKSKYFGDDCGIPDAVWYSDHNSEKFRRNLRQRSIPRRLINGFPLLKEYDLLEARMNDLKDTIDLFVFAESNYSAHLDPKPLYILKKLNQGFLKDFHHKIMYQYIGYFRKQAIEDSSLADQHLRIEMGRKALPRIKGLRDDDLFILNDADEIPAREVLMFLKLYDGYTEPISLTYQWTIYGFFWKQKESSFGWDILNLFTEDVTVVGAVSSIRFLRQLLEDNPFNIRAFQMFSSTDKGKAALKKYMQKYPKTVYPITIGRVNHYAGWHCSWCLSAEDIVVKLDAAQAGDKPRWGDYDEKHELPYLQHLIDTGEWFDGSNRVFLTDPLAPQYAPPFLLANKRRFHSLLYHPKQIAKLNKIKSKRAKKKRNTSRGT